MKSCRRILTLFVCLGAAVAWGQEFRATLTGRVVDPSDAPIPNGAVSVVNEQSNSSYSAKTDTHGNYTVPLLPPGSYSVTVTAPGFKVSKRSGVVLTVAETSALDIKLEIGGLNQEVRCVNSEGDSDQRADADRVPGGDFQRDELVLRFTVQQRDAIDRQQRERSQFWRGLPVERERAAFELSAADPVGVQVYLLKYRQDPIF